MVSKTLPIILLSSILALISCASKNEFPVKYSGEQIHFGQGGGFTGGVNYYALLDNGKLFQRSAKDSTFTYINRWDRTFVNQMMDTYQKLELDSVSCYEPGDIYYFILHRKKNAPFHRITWGRNGFRPDPKIISYYNLLYKSTTSGS